MKPRRSEYRWGGYAAFVAGLLVGLPRRPRRRYIYGFVTLGSAALTMLAAGPSGANATVRAPAWSIRSVAFPTIFCNTHDCSEAYFVTATNIGSAPSSGEVVINDMLPHGTSVAGAEANLFPPKRLGVESPGPEEELSCASTVQTVACRTSASVPPGGIISARVSVAVSAPAGSEVPPNRAEVREEQGGGASSATAEEVQETPVGGGQASFGAQQLFAYAFGNLGERDLQAGSHPDAIQTAIAYTTASKPSPAFPYPPVAEPKIVSVNLPLGLVGDARVTPQCTEVELTDALCPSDTRVGVASFDVGDGAQNHQLPSLYNLVPQEGYPAEFGFSWLKNTVILRPRLLPSAAGNVLSVAIPGVPQAENYEISEVSTLFFGDPAAVDGTGTGEAVFTNPDDCGASRLTATLETDPWLEPGNWPVPIEAPVYEASHTQSVTGCDRLPFGPELDVKPVGPEAHDRDTPTGYEVELTMPGEQEELTAPEDLAPADLKNAVVTLPRGVSVSPGAADGLVACQASGAEGIELGNHDQPDADKLASEGKLQEGEEIGADGLVHPAPGHCPAASQVGEVEVQTPLLAAPLKGHVYVAAPLCGGAGQSACTPSSAQNGELFGLYLEICSETPSGQCSSKVGSGVIVKLRGYVSVNPQTGQLTASFKEAPQLPFSKLRLKFKGGQGAVLANPQQCGTFGVTSDLTPWSTPYTPDATPSGPPIAIEGCGGAFAPQVETGLLSTKQAGAPSGFVFRVQRRDGEANIAGVQTTLPAGLVGLIARVPLCGEPQAAEGTCGEESKIGTASVAVGSGTQPYWETGQVYLTGPYGGAPFGLSVVVPAKAGPFNLGHEVVRAAITINPLTTAVTVTSAAVPQFKDGVPLRLKTLNVEVNRPGFLVNPTSCEAQSITGSIAGVGGASEAVSVPFGVEGCPGLPFAPVLSAYTQGRASKADGASLDVRISYPSGSQANIRSVKTELPVQLPSRLSTLQRACNAPVFEANPADCPAESLVGVAKASSPVLPVELTGPVYLVSHTSEAWPNLVIVLQGEGVRVDLIGLTDVKKGITTTTFESVPDDPVASFELFLPEGPFSALGANLPEKDHYDLCGHKLTMPTVITAQNGTVVKRSTTIGVTGCVKAKPKKKAKAKKAKHAKKASRARKAGGKR